MPPPSHRHRLGLVWLRRDLRLSDHTALCHALAQCQRVALAFVFDADILTPLPRHDRRVVFIHQSLQNIEQTIQSSMGMGRGFVHVVHPAQHPDGRAGARQGLLALVQCLGADAVYANHDDEPFARARDAAVQRALAAQGVAFHTFKDHVVFERDEILTQAGKPYTVFTPYKRAWWAALRPEHVAERSCAGLPQRLMPVEDAAHALPPLAALGFEPIALAALRIAPGEAGAHGLLEDFLGRIGRYHEARDYPAVKGPSYLGVHLRFGTLSVRAAVRAAWPLALQGNEGADTWLSELIWREFYHQVLHHHPRVVGHAFKPAYDAIEWNTGHEADARFAAWCAGRTGYPLVDAAMRQLNQTGYMHNRLRMLVASFFTKHLGLDWRRGEAYFALHLTDFDLAANNGGWQWAASTGCDAQPYFRIFHPVRQSEKFDAQGAFIRRYCPELAALPAGAIHAPWLATPADLQAAGVVLGVAAGATYPAPLVDHASARRAALARYAVARPDLTPIG